MNDPFYIFLGLGIAFGLFYATWGNKIFHYNADSGQESNVENKQKNIKKAPWAWKLEQWLHIFIGVFIGWMLFWVLLDLRLKIFNNSELRIDQLGFIDLILFLFAFVGINGRLPTIAHSIEKWFSLPR